MNVSKITVARLYNLGNFEHCRYELTIDIPAGESAGTALLGAERILEALNPKTSTHDRDDLDRGLRRLRELETDLVLDENEFRRKHGHIVGTPTEYHARCSEMHNVEVMKRDAWEAGQAKARKLLDDLGGAANWKDAKLDWEDDDYQP